MRRLACTGASGVSRWHPQRARLRARAARRPSPCSPRSSTNLSLAQAGVARAEQRWRDHARGWYDARLGDRDRYPLATIWDIVPLFQSLDAIAIAQPTPANRRAVTRFATGAERYLNRGLRPLPGYSPYPGDRAANTETWFDDNGWWGLAFVNAYRATGSRRWLADAERALRYIARSAGIRTEGRHLVEHRPPLQGRRGARLGHAAGDAALPADALELRARPGAQVPRLGQHRRLQRRGRPVCRQQPEPDADRLHRGAADLRAGGALRSDRDGWRLPARRAPEEHRADPLRLPARLLAAVRRDLPAVDARAVLARPRPAPCTRSPPTTRATRRRARSTAKASTCSPGTARRLHAVRRARDAADAGRHHEPVRVAGRLPAAGLNFPLA